MREISHSIEIDAPAPVVWRVLMDFAAYPEWSRFIQLIEGETAMGRRLRVRLQPPGRREMTIRPVVSAVDDGRVFAWRGSLGVPGLFDGTHRFMLKVLAGGRTRLVHSEQFRGLLVPLVWPKIGPATEEGFVQFNRALKARAESFAGKAVGEG